MVPRLGLRFVALAYLTALLAFPVAVVFWRAFEAGLVEAWTSVTTPEALHALWLSVLIACIAVPLNTVFGVLCALAIVRRRFRGHGLVNTVVDLPLALSPVVVGLALILVYGRNGWLPEMRTTAPNSPIARANASAEPDRMAGSRFGKTIRRKIARRRAPSDAAASSMSRSSSSSTGCTVRTTNGSVTKSSAMTRPARVYATLTPAGPRGP